MNTDEVQVAEKDRSAALAGETVKIEGVTPIVVDLGKRSKKAVRNLKEGRGKLMSEVGDTVEQVRANLGAQGRDVLPVVIIYRQKEGRKKRGASSLLPFVPPPFNLLR